MHCSFTSVSALYVSGASSSQIFRIEQRKCLMRTQLVESPLLTTMRIECFTILVFICKSDAILESSRRSGSSICSYYHCCIKSKQLVVFLCVHSPYTWIREERANRSSSAEWCYLTTRPPFCCAKKDKLFAKR